MKKKRKGEKGRKRKAKKKDDFDFNSPRIFFGLILILVLLGSIYFIMQNDDSLEFTELEEELEVDSFSEEAFRYINKYRIDNGIHALGFSYEAYLVALDMSNQKERNNLKFRQVVERNEFLDNAMDLSDTSDKYTSIYSIDGSGIESFKGEFDRIYFVRNIIRLEKYTHGAIGCNLNYCTLVILGEEGGIELKKGFY